MPASMNAGGQLETFASLLNVLEKPVVLQQAPSLLGPVSVRSHPPPEAGSNTIGLEAIIRKALMGNLEEQMDDRSPSGSVNSMNVGVPAAGVPAGSSEGRCEDPYSLPGAPDITL